jgi:DNA-binding IclR family transcriptional regulator
VKVKSGNLAFEPFPIDREAGRLLLRVEGELGRTLPVWVTALGDFSAAQLDSELAVPILVRLADLVCRRRGCPSEDYE